MLFLIRVLGVVMHIVFCNRESVSKWVAQEFEMPSRTCLGLLCCQLSRWDHETLTLRIYPCTLDALVRLTFPVSFLSFRSERIRTRMMPHTPVNV